MRAVLQRVASARVEVQQEIVGTIERGFLVLLGVHEEDTEADAEWMAGKIAELRVFGDEAGKMNLSLAEVGGAVLIVSQFTLFGDCRKGRRPSFDRAAPREKAEALYLDCAVRLRARGISVATGRFGAMMQVALVNDGPVTLLLDSRDSVS